MFLSWESNNGRTKTIDAAIVCDYRDLLIETGRS